MRLATPDTTPGSRYTCQPESGCQPATTDIPAELNRSGTSFLTLPRQCGGRFHQIVILEANSADPKVDVTCAPAEDPGPIGEMNGDGAAPIEEMQ